jgi:HNH endonuclease/NUMOD3 motif
MRTREAHAEAEKYRNEARRVWKQANGPIPKDELGRTYQIHHKDQNKRNNSLDNLQCVSRHEHDAIHLADRIRAGRTFSTGRGLSKDTRAKIGDANRGKVRSAEARAKIAAWRRGKPMNQETKQKIALCNIGKNKGRKKSAEELARREASKAAKRLDNPAYGKRFSRTAKRRSPFSEADILAIRARHGSGEGPSAIAKDYNVQPNSIWRICSGRRWRHVVQTPVTACHVPPPPET